MTLLHLLSVAWGWLCPASPAPASSSKPSGAGGACYMELIVGRDGHIFVFRIRDRQSRDLLLPATMRWAVNEELPFADDDAAEVVYEAADVWGRCDELERCRGK